MTNTSFALFTLTTLSACAARTAVAPERWQVTSGMLEAARDGKLIIEHPSTRAELTHGGSAAALKFVYRGPTLRDAPLASGELRRQIGLKLRAHDTCNVLYVMWQIEPAPRIEVSLKENPGQHTHAQCADHGYTFIRPEVSRTLAAVLPGREHELRAQLAGRRLSVLADGTLVWDGQLPERAFDFDGPLGLRADNGRFELQFQAVQP
jgi:hypothetical protein